MLRYGIGVAIGGEGAGVNTAIDGRLYLTTGHVIKEILAMGEVDVMEAKAAQLNGLVATAGAVEGIDGILKVDAVIGFGVGAAEHLDGQRIIGVSDAGGFYDNALPIATGKAV
ncbi:MAG: hypothetical protein AAGG75_25220 [Bacteroidota bacterium]